MISFSTIQQIELTNQNIIITGANSGLGFEAAKHFAKKKANVFLCSRDVAKGEKAKAEIVSEVPQAKIEVMQLDLNSLASIDAFSKEIQAKKITIDILLNNAGIMAVPYEKTEDGFEKQMGVNHLGHFYLTSTLFNALSDTARIVNVSSMAYAQGKVDVDNFMFENGSYSPFKSYSRSKLANILFTLELAKRLEKDKRKIVVVAAHPGVANTNLFAKKNQDTIFSTILRAFSGLVATPYEGTKPIIAACVDSEANNGYYYGPYKQRKNKGEVIRLETLNDTARNVKNQKFLWDFSIQQTKAEFPF